MATARQLQNDFLLYDTFLVCVMVNAAGYCNKFIIVAPVGRANFIAAKMDLTETENDVREVKTPWFPRISAVRRITAELDRPG